MSVRTLGLEAPLATADATPGSVRVCRTIASPRPHRAASADDSAGAAEWTHYTGEQERTQRQLLELEVAIHVSTSVEGFDGEAVTLGCVYSGRQWQQRASTLVLVTSREPQDELYRELLGGGPDGERAPSIQRIGDCRQPALIAHAVFSGHQAARELDAPPLGLAVRRDRSVIG